MDRHYLVNFEEGAAYGANFADMADEAETGREADRRRG